MNETVQRCVVEHSFELREAQLWDCGQIIRRLRPEHVAAFGGAYYAALRRAFDRSAISYSFFIDDELMAIYGVTGTLLAPFGYVWSAFAAKALKRFPVTLTREARRHLRWLSTLKMELVTGVMSEDRTSIEFAVAVGFRPKGNLKDLNRREMAAYISDTPALRIPFGDKFVIALRHQGEKR